MHTRISLHTSLLFFPPLSVSHSTIAIGRGTDKRNAMYESYNTTQRIKIIQFATTALHQLCATPPHGNEEQKDKVSSVAGRVCE